MQILHHTKQVLTYNEETNRQQTDGWMAYLETHCLHWWWNQKNI